MGHQIIVIQYIGNERSISHLLSNTIVLITYHELMSHPYLAIPSWILVHYKAKPFCVYELKLIVDPPNELITKRRCSYHGLPWMEEQLTGEKVSLLYFKILLSSLTLRTPLESLSYPKSLKTFQQEYQILKQSFKGNQ